MNEMKRHWAMLGSIVFFFAAPGTAAGVVPYLITGWREGIWLTMPLRVLGASIAIVGLLSLSECFIRFAFRGRGTPAPVAPPSRLVVSGQYCHVRNPMYLALVGIVAGQALIFGSVPLLAYAAGLLLLFHAWVIWYEEPRLSAQFGSSYQQYRQRVRRWQPRVTAWRTE